MEHSHPSPFSGLTVVDSVSSPLDNCKTEAQCGAKGVRALRIPRSWKYVSIDKYAEIPPTLETELQGGCRVSLAAGFLWRKRQKIPVYKNLRERIYI